MNDFAARCREIVRAEQGHDQTSTGRGWMRFQSNMNESQPEFIEFPKMARLNRECIITEKIDGTNAQVFITESGDVFAGSRSRWITPSDDNFGFAKWVEGNKETILKLGPGRHFGEWWGCGIQRNYGLKEKRWSLFNVSRWCEYGQEPKQIPSNDPRIVKMQEILPEGLFLVPVIHRGPFMQVYIKESFEKIRKQGSLAVPGFMNPEGIVIFHTAANTGFKVTLQNDEIPKSLVK